MKLQFDQEYLSIGRFADVDLPIFSVLTGVNGSGKTHLLKAIANGSIRIEGVLSGDIKYYHYDHFRLSGNENSNAQRNYANTVWAQTLNNRGGNGWQQAARRIFQKRFGDVENIDQLKTDQQWHLFLREEPNKATWRAYLEDIENEIYNSDIMYSMDERDEIVAAFRRLNRPIHLINQTDFTDRFVGVNEEDRLSISISDLFTKYMVRQAKWVFDRWSTGSISLSRESLDEEFQSDFPPPWAVLNDLLDSIHGASEHLDAPLFQFSVPEPGSVTPQEWARYRFNAQLIDRRTGERREYDALSSGEKILVSLVVATYSSRAGPFPKLLLLDEVDACLHPSLVRALLTTCRSAFVEQGTAIILATHSPTTVALSPDEAIFVVEPGQREDKVVPVSKAAAMAVMTEGFATLDEGQLLFRQTLDSGLHILTEGNNVAYLELYFRLRGLSGVKFIKGLEASSGKDQLKQYATFLQAVPHEGVVLIIFDPDVAALPVDGGNVYSVKIKANAGNSFCKGGIEQAFAPKLFDGYLNTVMTSTGGSYQTFDKSRKTDFMAMITQRSKLADFAAFDAIYEKARTLMGLR